MQRFALLVLLTLSTLVSAAAFAHSFDFCQPGRQECDGHALQAAHPAGDSSAPEAPHDCPCPGHHHNCSHQPLLNGRAPSALPLPTAAGAVYWPLPARFLSSPPLEGPFQPPKA